MIFHIIRNSSTRCLFQEIIQLCFHKNYGDEFYISSGFFQEGKGGFYAVNSLDSFGRSFANNPYRAKQSITTKGIHTPWSWKNDYDLFVDDLVASGYKVNKIYNPGNHAKVFICCEKTIPKLEIIGSSNITSRAYGISKRIKFFNTEADLVIIDDSIIEKEVLKLIDNYEARNYVIALDYNQKYNSLNLQDEMNWIKNNLF